MAGKSSGCQWERGAPEGRCERRSSGTLAKGLPWGLHSHGSGWRFLVNPRHFGSPEPPREGASRSSPPPAPPSPATGAATAAGFVLRFADMLMASLIITTRSCNWAHSAWIQGALEKRWLFPYRREF